MDPTPAATTKPKGNTSKLPIILTDISAILGLLMLIMSFAYLFIAVSVTKQGSKNVRDCSCGKNRRFAAINACLTGNQNNSVLIPGANSTINLNKLEDSQTINRFCRNMAQEIGAGSLGILFGLFQMAIASVFLLAGVPDALKCIWIIVHAVIAFVCTVIVLCVLDVMLYKFLNRNKFGNSIYFPDAFLHDGSPSSVRKGNTVLFVYLTFVFLDAITTICGIGLMFLTKPKRKVGNTVKPVSKDVPMSEPAPTTGAGGSAAAIQVQL